MFQKEKKSKCEGLQTSAECVYADFLQERKYENKAYQARAFFILLDELVVSKV